MATVKTRFGSLENYEKAILLNNGQYATSYLRAGIVYNRKQNTEKAATLFDKAEQLYAAATNSEGVNDDDEDLDDRAGADHEVGVFPAILI